MAGRIPQHFIDTLLDRVDIVDVVDRRVALKKTGKNYSARCPFHDEKTPSFSVNPEKQFYYCFGCGAGGNAIGFVMDYENLDFPRAVESLAASVGLEVPRETPDGAPASGAESPHRALYAFMERCDAFYREALRQHPQAGRAVDYLKARGLSGLAARDFGLGYAPPGWDNLHQALAADSDSETLALQTGMLVKNDAGRIYDRFRDRVVFPIRDRRGRVIAFGGRVLGDDKPKYLNSPETPIFHKGRELYGLYEARRANRSLERIIVVEGYMDVIALAQHGISNAVATLGTATSGEHLERIFRATSEVVFCFDGDRAGRQAADRALEAALPVMADGRQARFLFLREGEDPDSLVRSEGAAAFNDLLAAAQPLESYLFESQAAGLDLRSIEGRASLSKRTLPLLRRLPDGVFRELMFRALAERTGLDLESLLRLELPREEPAPPPPAAPPADEEPLLPRRRSPLPARAERHATLAQEAIALILHRPAVAAMADAQALSQLPGQEGALLREMLELLHRRPESTTGMLLGHWHGTPEGDLLTHLAGQERLIPTEGIERQFEDIIRRLSSLPLRQRIVEEINGLKSRDYAQLGEDDKARLRELIRALRDLDQRSRPA
jgi:DNA primase